MELSQFESRLKKTSLPVMVEFWAPWCAPCKMMSPRLEKISKEYEDKVELIKINADQSPAVLQKLGIRGIPTLVAYRNGQEVFRRTGAQQLDGLRVAFEALFTEKPFVNAPSRVDRLIRVTAGLGIGIFGWITGPSYLLLALGATLLFSAVYDRCPIYRALAPRLAGWLKRFSANKS